MPCRIRKILSSVRVCRGVRVGAADYRTTLEFLPRLSAFQKALGIFHLEQEHALDSAVGPVFRGTVDANVNSSRLLLQNLDVNLRVPRPGLEHVVVVQL